MALVFTGTRTRSNGILCAIKKQCEYINLKPAKRIIIKLDPFAACSSNLRQFCYVMNRRCIIETNPNCRVRTEVICGDSSVEIKLETGESLLMKSGNLDVVDMLKLFNKHVSSLVPKEDSAENLTTKKQLKKKVNSK